MRDPDDQRWNRGVHAANRECREQLCRHHLQQRHGRSGPDGDLHAGGRRPRQFMDGDDLRHGHDRPDPRGQLRPAGGQCRQQLRGDDLHVDTRQQDQLRHHDHGVDAAVQRRHSGRPAHGHRGDRACHRSGRRLLRPGCSPGAAGAQPAARRPGGRTLPARRVRGMALHGEHGQLGRQHQLARRRRAVLLHDRPAAGDARQRDGRRHRAGRRPGELAAHDHLHGRPRRVGNPELPGRLQELRHRHR